MRVLVTGGAGFIGSHIAELLLAAGHHVRVLDSLDPAVHPAGGTGSVPLGAELLAGDAANAHTVAQALSGVDAVVHQSAKVGLGVRFGDAPDYVRNNDLATAVLLAAMDDAGVDRLVLASSMVVYGEGAYATGDGWEVRPGPRSEADLLAGNFEPLDPATGQPLVPQLLDENAVLDPRNVYAASKLAQENLASAWARATGGSAVALRYHNVYGPRMPANTPYAGVASLFRSALSRGEPPRVFEDGLQRRSFVHVEDVARANLLALDAGLPGFRAFNVGATQVNTIGEVAAALSRNYGGPDPVVTGEFRLGDVRHITASSARIGAELGWTPQWSFEDGMRQFANAPLRGE